MSTQQIGESQITPQVIQQVTPDVVSPQGKQQLMKSLGGAMINKPMLDDILGQLAKKIGATFSSRIKNPQTTVQKIAQKRIEGRKYGTEDINDPYGARIVVDNKSDISKAKQGIRELADKGALQILKSESVKNDTYSAYHIDIKTPDGVSGEIQIMTPSQELESVANHGLRAIYGEKQKGDVNKLREKQADIASKISPDKARQASATIQDLSKGRNIDPRIIASVLQKA